MGEKNKPPARECEQSAPNLKNWTKTLKFMCVGARCWQTIRSALADRSPLTRKFGQSRFRLCVICTVIDSRSAPRADDPSTNLSARSKLASILCNFALNGEPSRPCEVNGPRNSKRLTLIAYDACTHSHWT